MTCARDAMTAPACWSWRGRAGGESRPALTGPEHPHLAGLRARVPTPRCVGGPHPDVKRPAPPAVAPEQTAPLLVGAEADPHAPGTPHPAVQAPIGEAIAPRLEAGNPGPGLVLGTQHVKRARTRQAQRHHDAPVGAAGGR